MLTPLSISVLILAYLCGSIPTAVWIGQAFYGVDVREYGSGNAGATNTFRVLGKKAGIPVMLLDILKGFTATNLAFLIPIVGPHSTYISYQLALGIAAVMGHLFPVFAGFRGGKGVATLFGMVLAHVVQQPRVAPMIALLSLSLVFLVLSVPAGARLTRRRHLGIGAAIELAANLAGAAVAVTLAMKGAGAWSLVAQFLSTYAIRAIALNITAFKMPAFEFSLSAIRPHMASGGLLVGTRICEYLGRVGENVKGLVEAVFLPEDGSENKLRPRIVRVVLEQGADFVFGGVVLPGVHQRGNGRGWARAATSGTGSRSVPRAAVPDGRSAFVDAGCGSVTCGTELLSKALDARFRNTCGLPPKNGIGRGGRDLFGQTNAG